MTQTAFITGFHGKRILVMDKKFNNQSTTVREARIRLPRNLKTIVGQPCEIDESGTIVRLLNTGER